MGVEFIPGVELSTDVGPFEVHILGYFVDPADPTLTGALADLARQRVGRVGRIVARLAEIGRPVELERVRAIAGEGTIGRPHIARAMVERGYVASVAEAFDRYLASGRPGFVPRTPNSPEGAVRLLRAAHAVPVLAHPLTAGDIEGILTRLVPAGLLGMECYYGEYDDATCAELRRTADRWGLIPTGGSDYHGPNFKEGRDLGSVAVPADCVDRLRVASRTA